MTFEANDNNHPVVMALANTVDELIDKITGLDAAGDLAATGAEKILELIINKLTDKKESLKKIPTICVLDTCGDCEGCD